jgi:hypothetical protein
VLVGRVADRVSYGAAFAVGGVAAVLGLTAFFLAERRARGLPARRPSPA